MPASGPSVGAELDAPVSGRAASESLDAAGGRLGSAMGGTGGESTSATEVPERTNTGLRSGDCADESSRGGATPSKVWSELPRGASFERSSSDILG